MIDIVIVNAVLGFVSGRRILSIFDNTLGSCQLRADWLTHLQRRLNASNFREFLASGVFIIRLGEACAGCLEPQQRGYRAASLLRPKGDGESAEMLPPKRVRHNREGCH